MPLPKGPESATCVCGSTHWQHMIERTLLWCERCGSIRAVFSSKWRVPLDRAGDIARSVVEMPDEAPTSPGTPDAKKAP